MMIPKKIRAIRVSDIPQIQEGDDIAKIILKALETSGINLEDNDILVVASKIVSKAEGRIVHGKKVKISIEASNIAYENGFDPVQVELALRESKSILRKKGVLITETRSGLVCNFSGVDKSNIPDGSYVLLPEKPDDAASAIYRTLKRESGKQLAVIISDTQGRPWRKGSINIAIGCAGISPFKYNKGRKDLYGRILERSTICQVDEIASFTEPLMGQAAQGVPVVIVRGYSFLNEGGVASDINRAKSQDLFR